jgi:cupin fold WbuC family metalloprotein
MSLMRRFDQNTLDQTIEAARTRPRKRANFNVHQKLDDEIQRMVNVFQPGSYACPHHHIPSCWELFIILKGRAGVLTFDDAGSISDSAELGPDATWSVEIPGGAWHTVFALAPDTVLFEVKPGPYRPIEDKDFAPWAPREGQTGIEELLASWAQLFSEA